MKINKNLEKSLESIADNVDIYVNKWWEPSLIISLFALIISLVSVFGFNISPDIEVYSNQHLIPHINADNISFFKESMFVGITYTFLNKGKEAGIIEDIYINVLHENATTSNQLVPINHYIDKNFIYNCVNDPKTNNGIFNPLIVPGEQSIQRTYLFSTNSNIKKGKYNIKSSIEIEGRKTIKNSTIVIDDAMYNNYVKGNILFDLNEIKPIYSLIVCSR